MDDSQPLQDSGQEASEKSLPEPVSDWASGDQETSPKSAVDLDQENARLSQLVKDLTSERAGLVDQVSQLKGKLQDFQTQEENLKNQNVSLTRELNALRQQANGASRELDDSMSCEDQSANGKASRSSSAQRRDENSDLERLRKRNEELVREVRSLQKKYNAAVKKGKKATEQSRSAAAVREVAMAIKDIENWEKRTSSLKASLQSLTANLESEELEEPDDSELRSVEVEIWEPNKEDTEWETVALTKGERCWREILARIDSLAPALDKLNLVVIQWGHLFNEQGKTARAIQVLDHNSHVSEFRGRNGAIIEKERATHSLRHFLHPTQPVITCAGHTPLLTVVKECRVMCVGRSKYFRLVNDHFESLFDPESLVLIWGLWLGKKREKWEKIFIQLNGRSFCDSETGQMYDNEAAVYAAEAGDEGEWNYLLLILRNGDRVPWFQVPVNTPVAAFTRFPFSADIVQGRVQARRTQRSVDGGAWVTTKEIGEFDRKLTAAMLGEM